MLRWKIPDEPHKKKIQFKLGTPKRLLEPLTAMMLDIVLKMIIHNVGSKSELSTGCWRTKFKLTWASYIFAHLLDNVKRNHTMKRKTPKEYNDVYFGLMISLLLQKKMPKVDRGEDLADSGFWPHKNARGRKFKIGLDYMTLRPVGW